jgi:hypothetical protein
LEAAGVFLKSDLPGEITLVDKFYTPMEFTFQEQRTNPFGIESILNQPREEEPRILECRRTEFFTKSDRYVFETPGQGEE